MPWRHGQSKHFYLLFIYCLKEQFKGIIWATGVNLWIHISLLLARQPADDGVLLLYISVVTVICLCQLILFKIVYLSIYVKLGSVVCMTKQIADGRDVDIVIC